MVFPWVQFLRKKKKLSDIEYLAIKEFGGKLVTNEGTRTTTGDIATLTASSGKDMYLAKAKVSVRASADNTSSNAIIELKVNGAIKATYSARPHISSGLAGSGAGVNYEFVVSGLKVAATQIIKLEAVTLQTQLEVNGELVCFEETTGASPAV